MSRPSSDQPQVKDYFGTFLESVKQASPEYPDQAPSTGEGSAVDAANAVADAAAAAAAATAAGGADAAAADDDAPAVAPVTSAADVSGVTVIQALTAAGNSLPLSALLQQLGVGSLEAGQVITPLVQARVVSVDGAPGDEIVSLTPDGSRLSVSGA